MTPITQLFPSERWFDELVARARAQEEAMTRLGVAFLRLGIELVDDEDRRTMYGLVFDGYDVESIGQVDDASFRPDVVLSGSVAVWREMVSNIEANGGADLSHTINTLSIVGDPLVVRAVDPMGADSLYRFMGTIQAVFDAAGTDAVVTVG